MPKIWNILYYQSFQQKTSPVFDFIENLDVKAQVKVANTLDLLEQYGTHLGAPHIKKLSGTDLWELRILGKNNIRIFYILIVHDTFLLLHGFVKKKQKTDRKEIVTARERLHEYMSRVRRKRTL